MPTSRLWTEDEWALLLDVYLREGSQPRLEALEEAHEVLRATALMSEDPELRRTARDPSYRSLDAVWAQFYVVRSLKDPSARIHVPQRLLSVWREQQRDPNLLMTRVRRLREPLGPGPGPFYMSERAALTVFVSEVSDLLGDAVGAIQGAVGEGAAETFSAHRDAWGDLERRGVVAQITEELRTADHVAYEEAGLSWPQLRFKLLGWRTAFREWIESPIADAMRRAFRWANVILGSMGKFVAGPGLEIFKEFKEGTEAAFDEAMPTGGFVLMPALA